MAEDRLYVDEGTIYTRQQLKNNTKNVLSSNDGKTIETNKNKINPLFNLVNLNHKELITGKNIDKIKQSKKLNIQENLSKFKTPLGSPKNLNKGNLLYQNKLNNIHHCVRK